METSRDKLDRIRRDQLPQLLDEVRTASPLAAMVVSTLAPTVDPMIKRELEQRSAEELDRLLTGAIELFASLRSDDAPDLFVNATGAYAADAEALAALAGMDTKAAEAIADLAQGDAEVREHAAVDLIRALGNEGVKMHYRIKAADPGGHETSQHARYAADGEAE